MLRKLIVLLSVAILSLSLFGCQSHNYIPKTSSNESTNISSDDTTNVPFGGDWTIVCSRDVHTKNGNASSSALKMAEGGAVISKNKLQIWFSNEKNAPVTSADLFEKDDEYVVYKSDNYYWIVKSVSEETSITRFESLTELENATGVQYFITKNGADNAFIDTWVLTKLEFSDGTYYDEQDLERNNAQIVVTFYQGGFVRMVSSEETIIDHYTIDEQKSTPTAIVTDALSGETLTFTRPKRHHSTYVYPRDPIELYEDGMCYQFKSAYDVDLPDFYLSNS